MELPPPKRIRLNPIGEDVYLLCDGKLEFDEDKIVKVQRRWLDNAYTPPNGVMYVKLISSFRSGQTASHTKPSGPSAS